jgi:acyl-CoA dehydrogenase
MNSDTRAEAVSSLLPFDLPANAEDLRRRLRSHITDELIPLEASEGLTEASEAPPALRQRVRTRSQELGFFRLAMPLEEGGGAGPVALTALREEIAHSGSVLARFLLGRDAGVLRRARGAQRTRYLEPVLRGERAYAFAFTEPRAGSGPGGARTTAIPDADGYRLSGTKSFVTDGPYADFLLVLAGVLDAAGAPAGTALFIVDRETPGLEIGERLETMDGGVHCVYHLRDVHVPAGNVLGDIGEGMPRALENINLSRLSLAATAAGTAWRVLDLTLRQTAQPHRSGVPLAQREQVQAMLGEMAADTVAARALTYHAASAVESGRTAEVETALAKLTATEAAGRVVDRAIQLHGAAAYVHGHPLERLYRVVRGWRIAEGTTEILKLGVARGLLDRVTRDPSPTTADPRA